MTDNEKIQFLEKAFLELFKEQAKILPLLPSTPLADLGLDSLDIVQLQMHYEDVTGNLIDTDDIIITVADLIEKMK